MAAIRLGAVDYLNARPLVHGIEQRTDLFALQFDAPSKCATLLHEGAIDVGMIFGTGFPPFKGGLLRYADSIGIGEVLDELARFREQYQSDRFTPCRLLLELKKKGKTFYNR